MAPWSDDAKPSAIACLNYSTKTNHDNFYACANGINDGKYGYNNLQHYDATWYSQIQREVAHGHRGLVHVPARSAKRCRQCRESCLHQDRSERRLLRCGELTCTAPEYAIVNYVNREFNPHLFVGFRSDLLNDKKGQRTGIPGKYTENTLYATKYFGSTILVRPEIRFDHSWDRPGYNNGHSKESVLLRCRPDL